MCLMLFGAKLNFSSKHEAQIPELIYKYCSLYRHRNAGDFHFEKVRSFELADNLQDNSDNMCED